MPALWKASEKPMYVRTVWVDGFRHAILTRDDPYLLNSRKKRPHSSSNCIPNRKPISRSIRLIHNDNETQESLKKINLVIRSSNTTGRKSAYEPVVERLNLIDIDQDSDECSSDCELKILAQPLSGLESTRAKYKTPFSNMKNIKNNRSERSEAKENNDLSDRVLQWLDLAGKVDLLAAENVERMSQQRHSWPGLQKRNINMTKSKTILDMRVRVNSKTHSPKADEQTGNIDRHDICVPTATNTIENYARQSRNLKSTTRDEANTRIKDQLNKTKSNLRTNVLETRHKIVIERNAVEKQYSNLVSKKMIQDFGKETKKQVHIFMPDVPKKIGSTMSG